MQLIHFLQKVQDLLKIGKELHCRWASNALCRSLFDGVKLLQKAYDILPRRFPKSKGKLIDAEDILKEVQVPQLKFVVI